MIAGIKLCRAYRRQYGCSYISLMPTNLYGPGDSFDPEGGHIAYASSPRAHTDPPAAGTPASTPIGRTDDRVLRTGRTGGSDGPDGSGRDG